MKYETIKSFILAVLVGISFLLTFILWSYQPNYDDIYDKSYVNEVDVGGSEKTKNEIVEPNEIIFRNGEKIMSFIDPVDRKAFYEDLTSFVLSDYNITESTGRPNEDELFIELVFPNAVPAGLITSLFTFHDEVNPPNWSFERVFITFDKEHHSLELRILSLDERNQITATIEKSDTYEKLMAYMEDHSDLEEYIIFASTNAPIYLPKGKVDLTKQTLVASNIESDLFINALFSNPSLVQPNVREAYFTDGQRGMRILQDGHRLEFINPLQSTYEPLDPFDLLEKSINNINEHKGWTNDFRLEDIDKLDNHITYRLYYDGYPVFDHSSLTTIDQEWREQELYHYSRPLLKVGNLLNAEEVNLPSGQEVSNILKNDGSKSIDEVKDIQIGYTLTYLDDAHGLTLQPNWYILYQDKWMEFNIADNQKDMHQEGGG